MPATDEVWRLQGVDDNDASFFQKMASKGHYRKAGGSRQGIYICSPSGKLLSSINSLKADAVLETIKDGLSKWQSLPKKDRKLSEKNPPEALHRWEDSYPENGLVLKCAKSDLLTDPPNLDERGDRWNMDHVWFNHDEARSWLPENPKKGQIYQLPKKIKDRLFQFHMVDNVRGQTLPFAPKEIKASKLEVKIIKVEDSQIQIKINGMSRAIAKGDWLLGENDWTPSHDLDHSMETDILGKASYDLSINRFIEFEMVAIGKRRGKTQHNGRYYSPDTGHVGFLYTLASNSYSEKIAPAFIDLYNAKWIKRP